MTGQVYVITDWLNKGIIQKKVLDEHKGDVTHSVLVDGHGVSSTGSHCWLLVGESAFLTEDEARECALKKAEKCQAVLKAKLESVSRFIIYNTK